MRVPPWWVRRLVLAPLMPVGAVVALVTVPVVAVISLLVAPVQLARRRRPRGRALRAAAFAVAYLLGECACLLACLLLWLGTGAGWRLQGDRSLRAHRRVLASFLVVLMVSARRLFGFRLEVEETAARRGDVQAITDPAPLVVLARHAGPGASFVLIDLLLRRYGRSPRVVLAEELRLDPSIDVLLTRLGAAFITRGSGEEAAERITEMARSLQPGDALVLYPEGADWTPVRQLAAVRSLRRKGLVREAVAAMRMPHVLPPHPTGVVAALRGAPADCGLAVFTHTGHDDLQGAGSTWAALPLAQPLRMTWWRVPAAEVPRGPEVADWLQATWRDLDAWITEQAELTEATDATDEAPVLPA